jgi:hypothetical protein
MPCHIASSSLSTTQVAHLLDCVILDRVRDCIDLCALARLPDVSDAQMLGAARGAIARALRQLADDRERPADDQEGRTRTRYLNAICREVDPESSSSAAR